jgi:hypothetical protein
VKPASHFVVSVQGGAWQFSHRGTVVGPFPNKEEAVAQALEEAQALSREGDPSEVIVENEHRQFASEWRAEGAEAADLSALTSDD